MEKFKIVADSSADLLGLPESLDCGDIAFESVPLKILTDEKEYVDNKDLDVPGMVAELAEYKGRSCTSCPNADEWLNSFGDTENVFCVPISGNISGSLNAAVIAKDMYETEFPGRRVYVVNTLSAGPELRLAVEKICELIRAGAEFDEICSGVEKYTEKTGLLFLLQSARNFANNGRINPLIAKGIGLLGIRLLGRASDDGKLQLLEKCRGAEKALAGIVRQLKLLGCKAGKLRITHCLNAPFAEKVKEALKKEFKGSEIVVYECRGLCSFYAELGGLLVGFEKG